MSRVRARARVEGMTDSFDLHLPVGSRLACVGRTGTGKSVLARALFVACGGRRVVHDPYDDPDLTGGDWPTTASPRPDFSSSATWRVVPTDPDDLDFAGALYGWLFDHPPVTIWADEAMTISHSNELPLGVRRVLFQGRKRKITHIACSQRPAGVNPGVWAQSEIWAIFDLPWGPDRDKVAASAGMRRPDFEEYAALLGEHGFMWWEQRHNRLTVLEEGFSAELVAEIVSTGR